MKVLLPTSQRMRSTMLLTSGNLGGALLVLLRNILIARLISVEDFGIASTFAIAVTLVETGTNLGMDRLIVQDRRGGRQSFIAALHAIQILRGCIGACLVLIFAHGYASLMSLPEHTWAYQCLAVIPLTRSITNLGIFRAQRQLKFRPFVSVTIVSNLVAIATAVPVGLWFEDFRAMLVVLLVQQVCWVLMSHLVCTARYRVRWDGFILKDCLQFGVPLLVNGIVIFAILSGDQILVGSFLGMEVLGWFAVAFSLTLVPATVLANTLQALLLPRLVRCRSETSVFSRESWTVVRTCTVLAVCMSVVLALLGPHAVGILFGAKYGDAAQILPWLAVLQGIRVAKAGPAIVSIASAKTKDPLIANLSRLGFLPLALIWLGAGGGVMAIVMCAILGEMIALLVSLTLLVRRGTLIVPSAPQIARHV